MDKDQIGSQFPSGDAILDWVMENRHGSLPDCARYFAVGEEALRRLVETEEFRDRFERRLDAERMAGRGNPPCPRCGGNSTRLAYGLPFPRFVCDPLQTLWREAHEYTFVGCCVDLSREWRCRHCGREWETTWTNLRSGKERLTRNRLRLVDRFD